MGLDVTSIIKKFSNTHSVETNINFFNRFFKIPLMSQWNKWNKWKKSSVKIFIYLDQFLKFKDY